MASALPSWASAYNEQLPELHVERRALPAMRPHVHERGRASRRAQQQECAPEKRLCR